MQQYNELDIIKRCQNQCRQAQRELYIHNSSLLYSICLRYAKDTHDAEQILQDSFVKIFKKIDTYTFSGSFEGWMRKITVNTCLDFLRSKVNKKNEVVDYKEGEIDLAANFCENDAMSRLGMQELLSLIQELSPNTRAVFNLYIVEGYSHKEIAAMLNITSGTSQWHLNNARTILKEKIKKKTKRINEFEGIAPNLSFNT